MPNYYNPYVYNVNAGAALPSYYQTYQQPPMNYSAASYGMPANNYWISVDGEMAARAWQMPSNLPPNTIIPLWDLDGQHVYFKSTDAYGRINPIRKGRVVFDEEPTKISEDESTSCAPSGSPVLDPSKYVTKEDFDGLKHEIQDMLRHQQTTVSNEMVSTNQNGNGSFGNMMVDNNLSKGYSKNRR